MAWRIASVATRALLRGSRVVGSSLCDVAVVTRSPTSPHRLATDPLVHLLQQHPPGVRHSRTSRHGLEELAVYLATSRATPIDHKKSRVATMNSPRSTEGR